MKHKITKALLMIISISLIATICLISVSGVAEEIRLSFNYDIPIGYSAEESIEIDRGTELVKLTNKDTIITISFSSDIGLIGIDLAALDEQGLDELLERLLIKEFIDQNELAASVMIGDAEYNEKSYIEITDDTLTKIYYIEINSETGNVLEYSVTNTSGGSLTDDQLIVLDEILSSIVSIDIDDQDPGQG